MFFETTLTTAYIEANRTSGLWQDTHLIDSFAEKAAHLGDNPLVIDVHGVLSWRKAAEQVDELSRGLIELGVRKGTVVQLQLPNRREFLLLVLAIERIGAVVNPIAPIFRSNEVTVMSALARPSIVITVDNFRGFNLAEMHVTLQEQSPWVDHVIVIDTMGEAIPADALEYDRLLAVGRQSTIDDRTLALLRPDPNDVCEIIFTSGTTGQPKGVMHNQNTLNVAAELWLERVAEGCDVFHMASTLAHQTGYLYGVRAPILAGGTIVYQQVWDPVEFAGLIQEHGIHASMGATPFLADLLDVDGLATYDLSSFTAFVCAGAAIPLPVLERARDMLPCTVLPGWGMTETALSTIGRRDDAFAKLSTDGVALTGNETRVVDEHGVALEAGIEGDLQFRGSLTFIGYIQGRELTESCFRDGWFDTGDRAIIDTDGYVSISGRTKDIVIRGGENIPVKEVEDVLLRHPNVANVAVVAQLHERLGEVSCAVILPDGDPPTLADLITFLDEQNVTKQFWPEDLRIVDQFPMTPSGKIQKYHLRDIVNSPA